MVRSPPQSAGRRHHPGMYAFVKFPVGHLRGPNGLLRRQILLSIASPLHVQRVQFLMHARRVKGQR